MGVVETIRAAMDGFDAFYDSTSSEETDEARKKTLAEIIRTLAVAESAKGREDVVTSRLVDLIIPNMLEAKPMSEAQIRERLLGVIGTSMAELEDATRKRILRRRLEGLVGDAADEARLHAANKSDEWGSRDLVYSRSIDGWDVTLGYFPEYIRHRVIYGQIGASPLINKSLALSVRYHKPEHHLVAKNGDGDHPAFLEFLKSKEVDRLAKAYGISYELPPLGNAARGTAHSAKGGYDVVVETLEKELRKSPYSAEKLLKDASSISVFHEDSGLSIHVLADFPKGHPDIGMSLAFVFGADFFNLTKQQWDEFKKMPPIAMAALQLLKD